jgi:DNA gyrase subunit B
MDTNEYSAKDIVALSGTEGVRKRPAMYIGSTGAKGFLHLLYEIVDNAIDEAQAGYAKNVRITLTKDQDVDVAEVSDNGRGIPVDMMQKEGKSALEVIMTSLHTGAKFDNKAYKVSGGLHGVGLTVVNSLSEFTEVIVKRDGQIYKQFFTRGAVATPLETIGTTVKEDTGTVIKFKPDPTIFSAKSFDSIELNERLKELGYLNPGISIILVDKRDSQNEKTTDYTSQKGISDFLEFIRGAKDPLTKQIIISKQTDSVKIDVGMQYANSYAEDVLSFVNKIRTPEGGTHVVGFRSALTRAITTYMQKNMKKIGGKGQTEIQGEDTREGLVAIISVSMQNPEFEGQTKEKLGNSTIKSIVDSNLYSSFSTYLEENPADALNIMRKVLSTAEAREASRKAKELARKKSLFEGSVLPGKLSDCTEDDPIKSEIFIVEGESAAGCFSGDVKVALADGRNLSFKELVEEYESGKQNFCYTIKNDGSIGIEKIINPRLTKRNAEVIKITLDNGEEIICTPDHEIMLRDSSYKAAKNLTKKDSIMPLNKRISRIGGRITIDGYEMVWDQNKLWIFTHMLSDEYNLKNNVYMKSQGDTRHHIDFNKRNNNPTNIVRITKEAHLHFHTQHLDKILHTPAVKEKAALAHKTTEYRNKIREWAKNPEVKKVMSKNSKKLWENKTFKEYMMRKFMEFYNSNETYREQNKEILNKQQKIYWSNPENRLKASKKVKNFYQQNPSAKLALSTIATKQWQDNKLLVWRSQKTKEQWTSEFRKKRKETYNKTYYNHTINLMKNVTEKYGDLSQFDFIRVKSRNKNVLSSKEFRLRFFGNDNEKMLEAVNNYNHKIKKIEWLNQKFDVYDIEVPETHNFALASGIFVHNSSKQGRDRKYQAILPLKGKILNVEKASDEKIFNNVELHAMVTAFGTGIRESFNPEHLRYHKIILLTDADVDGSHIRTLLLTFFYRYMRPLIEKGNIYIAQPPLYRVTKGREAKYLYSDNELNKALQEYDGKAAVQRYKGLGEMNPDQLWETTMNPENRVLKKISIKDARIADAIFSTLMGVDVEQRRHFLEEHSNEVSFLDI